MIKATELMVNEDGEVMIESGKFKTIEEFKKFQFFEYLKNGEIVEKPDYKDNHGEDMDPEDIKRFEKKIAGKKGIIVDWGVEYDRSYMFLEFTGDEKERSLLLTDKDDLIRKIGEAA